MSDWYKFAEPFSYQSATTCLVMSNAHNCKRVLEVGCGPGLHSELIAKSILQPNGGLLVSCDFSKEMVTIMKRRYDNSEYSKLEGNHFKFDIESDFVGDENLTVDPSTLVPADASRFVYGCMADNMRLPFPSEFFEAYVSNLSLMLV